MDADGETLPARDDFMPRPPGRLIRALPWVAALVVFELTMDPALVVIVGCSKFGWDQIRTARWLRRSDPIKARGKACRWFYLSWGMWRISLVATGLMFAIVFLMEPFLRGPARPGNGPNAPPGPFISATLLALFGFLASTLLSVFGLVSAWRSGSRIWVGREAIAAWKAKSWPPAGPATRPNRAHGLLLTAVPFTFIFLVFPWMIAALIRIFALIPGDRVKGQLIATGCMVLAIGCAIAMMWLVDHLKRRVVAHSPRECWPDQDGTPPSSSQTMFGSAFR